MRALLKVTFQDLAQLGTLASVFLDECGFLNYHALKGVDSSFIDRCPRDDGSCTVSRSVTSRGSRGSVIIDLDSQCFDENPFSFSFQVSGSVHVPIVDRIASLASPGPIRERQGIVDESTRRTRLAGGIEPIHEHEVLSGPFCLVCNHPNEFRPREVERDRLGESRVEPFHAFHVQVFQDDRVVSIREFPRYLVLPVVPSIADTVIEPHKFHARVVPIV